MPLLASLHAVPLFFCLTFLLVPGFEPFDDDVPWCSFLHISHACGSLRSLDLWVYSFHQNRKHFCHHFFIYLFAFSFLGLQLYIY